MYFNILCFGSLPSRWSVAPFTIFLTETNWRSNITAPIAGNGGFSIFLGFYSTCLRVSCSLFHYIRREFIVARVIYYTCNRDFKRLKVRTHLGNGASSKPPYWSLLVCGFQYCSPLRVFFVLLFWNLL